MRVSALRVDGHGASGARLAARRCVRTYNQMVVDQVPDAEVDRIFHALADGTRRDIVALAVRAHGQRVGVAKRYPMSFAAVQKHVAVLEGPGSSPRSGGDREQLVRTDVDTVHRARVLLDGIEELGGRGWTGSTTSWQPRSEPLEASDERDQRREEPGGS